MIYAIFKYERSSGRRSVLTLSIDKDSGGLTIRCPFCERRYRLNPRKRHLRARDGRVLTIPGHQVVLDRKLRPTISRPVLCPNVYCGWSVRTKPSLPAFDSAGLANGKPSRRSGKATRTVFPDC